MQTLENLLTQCDDSCLDQNSVKSDICPVKIDNLLWRGNYLKNLFRECSRSPQRAPISFSDICVGTFCHGVPKTFSTYPIKIRSFKDSAPSGICLVILEFFENLFMF